MLELYALFLFRHFGLFHPDKKSLTLENFSWEKLEMKMFLKNVGNQSGRLVGDKI